MEGDDALHVRTARDSSVRSRGWRHRVARGRLDDGDGDHSRWSRPQREMLGERRSHGSPCGREGVRRWRQRLEGVSTVVTGQ
ncbi:hypothetical protein SESBI_02543 [Sesbania bispinosa]|nr:hypothetical protein SESBI_02543 [Sesbania bispinosa]